MHSRLLTLVFALLLLGMQQGAQQHAIAHLGDTSSSARTTTGLQLPTDESACTVCALFASGSAAISVDGAQHHAPAAWHQAPRRAKPAPAVAILTGYLSRAPPSLL